MSLTNTRSIAFSAPGKALLAGGYLVLDPQYVGYSVALSARMHVVATAQPDGSNRLEVFSPQFESKWVYDVGQTVLTVVQQTHPNPFIAAVLTVCKAYFGWLPSGTLTVYSDSGFHSQANSHPGVKPRFRNHGRPIIEVPKTGLGSSAALTVVVTAGIIGLVNDTAADSRQSIPSAFLEKVYKIAQIAHSLAQGKVGSGFDVATAVYGSIQYKRFSPQLAIFDDDASKLKQQIQMPWDDQVHLVRVPPKYTLLMGDVTGGSETPSMVRKVLDWAARQPEESEPVYAALSKANLDLIHALEQDASSEALKLIIDQIRDKLRYMGERAGVPIEPAEQTRIIDAASSVEGVVNGVVPGAGGYDAVCMLIESSRLDTALGELRKLPSLAAVSWLDLRSEVNGLLAETPASY